MKNRYESSEVFTAYATMDAGYYMLQQLLLKLNKPRSPIESAVDKACGYNENIEIAKEAIVILKDIIEAKAIAEVDDTGDVQMLNNLQNFITNN